MSIALPRTGVGAGARARLSGGALALFATVGWATLSLAVRTVSPEAFLWLSGAGFAVASAWPFLRARKDGLDAGDAFPLFALYYCLSLLLRGIGVLTFVDSPYLRELGDAHSEHVRALVAWTFFHSTLGLVAALMGYHSRLAQRWIVTLAARLPSLVKPWRTSRVTPAVLVLMALGTAAATYRVQGLGGFAAAIANPIRAGNEGALGYWWLIALTEFAVVGFHVHMLRLLLKRDPRFLAHYMVIGFALSVPIYLISSSKFLLLRVLFLPWLFRHFIVKPVPVWKLLAIFAGFSALFPFFYAYRALGALHLDAFDLYWQNHDAPFLAMFNRSYGADSFMLILHRTGVTLPFQWGRSLSDLFVFWIPRLLWAHKPSSFGLTFPADYMPDVQWGAMTYVSSSLPGELYLDFHLPGVILGCALAGIAMRVSLGLARRGPGALLLHGYAFLALVHLVEGCIASQLEAFLTQLVPALLALLWLTSGVSMRRGSAPEVS